MTTVIVAVHDVAEPLPLFLNMSDYVSFKRRISPFDISETVYKLRGALWETSGIKSK
jgi:hypothetical protein